MAHIDDLARHLKETKQTFRKAILTLVERGRKTHDLDPLVSLLQELVTPSKTVNASEEEQVEDISPTTLEAAAILTKVKKIKSVDKGKRYKRRKSSKESAGTGLDFEEVKSAFEEVNTGGIKVSAGIEEINAGSLDVNTGSDPVTTDSIRVSVPSPDRGRREGKAPMTEEEETQASKKTKEQILQEEAGLAEAIRLDALEKALEKEEVAKQVHLDSLLAQRMAEEQELTEEQKKRKAQVQFEAQSYTEEDWDTIRAKLEANAELKESVLGKDLTVEDYAKRMVELVNQRRKHFAEERARAKRNKPMTQTQLRNYMSNFLKNQGTWKLTQLKKLNFEEVKAEFEKLVKQLDTYVPMNLEATKESLKRFGEELQTKTAKKLKFDDESTQPTEEKVEEDKDDKPTKKTGKRRKQIARKGLHTDLDKDDSEDSDEASKKDDSTSGTKVPINPVPVAIKSPSIADYKIIKQGRKGVYQIVRENGTDMVYISFGAMLTDISRDDLTELYRISVDIYMLIERKYPLSAEVCKAMLDKKLQGGKPDEDCYKLLKMMEKQAGIRKHKDWLVQEQTTLGKDFLNPLMADNLPKIVWLSTHHICMEANCRSIRRYYGHHRMCDVWSRKKSQNAVKASSSQAWLWHCRLSHLNFDTINLPSKYDIVTGLPKLKFVKDHLFSSCELGKAKRKSFKTKTTLSSKRRLQILHMDLCCPMRVESFNGKKYVLVIVDDYSRYTLTHFLRSKDETPVVLIDFLKLVQRGLHAQVRTV
ncbi:retrovirus-related pol polyprotein from transposon TNT 1-94 [Tanacetum coccineum]